MKSLQTSIKPEALKQKLNIYRFSLFVYFGINVFQQNTEINELFSESKRFLASNIKNINHFLGDSN